MVTCWSEVPERCLIELRERIRREVFGDKTELEIYDTEGPEAYHKKCEEYRKKIKDLSIIAY